MTLWLGYINSTLIDTIRKVSPFLAAPLVHLCGFIMAQHNLFLGKEGEESLMTPFMSSLRVMKTLGLPLTTEEGAASVFNENWRFLKCIVFSLAFVALGLSFELFSFLVEDTSLEDYFIQGPQHTTEEDKLLFIELGTLASSVYIRLKHFLELNAM
jgi:hypothetical protein